MSKSWRPVTSGAPSERMRSTSGGEDDGSSSGERAERIRGGVEGCVISPTSVVMPGKGEIGCKSIATILTFSRGRSSSGF